MSESGRPPDPDSENTHRLPEVAAQEDEAARQISHGGLGVITRLRNWRAERVIEKMDHKDRLYEDIGQAAAIGKREAPSRERPRTLPETIVDYRLQRRSDKKARAAAYAYRARIIHGPDTAPHVPSVRHGATESLLGAAIGRDHSHSFGQVVWGNILRLFEGPHISGYTPLKRKIEKAKIIGRVATMQATAAEARQQWLRAESEPTKIGNRTHKLTRRQQRKRDERASIAAEEPLRKEWRSWRRRRAEATLGRIDRGETYLQRGAERTREEAERLTKASARAGKLAVHETVATTRTAHKGGKYTARFYAEVARGAVDIYWRAAKRAGRGTANGTRRLYRTARPKK